MKILPAGDQALDVEFSSEIDDAVSRRVIALTPVLHPVVQLLLLVPVAPAPVAHRAAALVVPVAAQRFA